VNVLICGWESNVEDIKHIRKLLTDIKPLLEAEAAPGSQQSVAIFSAGQGLHNVVAQLEYMLENLQRWQPGPAETK
jgi:hypothetical protein